MASKVFFPLSLCFLGGLGAACGSVKDGPPDASTIDADQTGMATVETEAMIFGGTIGSNVGMIDVISTYPNNTQLDAIKTDAAGNGTLKVYPGGSVTAVYRRTVDMGAELITYLGVKPNDTLIFGSRNFYTPNIPNPVIGTQTYSWPVQAGVTDHCAFTSCSASCAGTAASVTFSESATCNRGVMDILYVARTGATLTHYSVRQNVMFINGQTVGIGAWATAPMANINVNGLPTEVSSVFSNWASVLDGYTERSFASGASGNPTGGAFTAQYPFHPTGDRTIGRLSLSRTGQFSAISIADQFNTGTLSQTVAAPMLPPWIQGITIAPALRKASWSLAPATSGISGDATVVRITWNRNIGGTNHFYQWYVIAPPSTSTITLPPLPAAFDAINLQPTDFAGVGVQVVELPVNGYDAVRAIPSRNLMCVNCALRGGDLTRAIASGFVE